MATACAADGGGCSASEDTIDLGVSSEELQPRRDEWRLELDAPFDALAVSRISIGGNMELDNFVNRGDVIVHFDGKPGRIQIEMRRFDFTRDPDGRFERLRLWTHRLDEGLGAPQDGPPGACAQQWDQDCGVRVHYDGQSQPIRSGADLRVTLPPEYVGHVQVVTQDTVSDEYTTRSDVCMLGLRGSSDVWLESGHAWVSLAPDIRVVPQCTEAEEQQCATADPPWRECPCIEEHGFGSTMITGVRANQLVSIPLGLWALAIADGEFPCEYGEEEPPDGVPAGTIDLGYAVSARSAECGLVEYFESPGDWRDDVEPDSEQRGDVEICRGCIEAVRCEELLR